MRRVLNPAFVRSDSDGKALKKMERFFQRIKRLHQGLHSNLFDVRGRFFRLSGLH
jgi:hypothetical protein